MIFEGDEAAPVPKALVKGQSQRKQRTNRRSWAIGRILDTAFRSHKFLAKTGTCNSGEKNRPARNGAKIAQGATSWFQGLFSQRAAPRSTRSITPSNPPVK